MDVREESSSSPWAPVTSNPPAAEGEGVQGSPTEGFLLPKSLHCAQAQHPPARGPEGDRAPPPWTLHSHQVGLPDLCSQASYHNGCTRKLYATPLFPVSRH